MKTCERKRMEKAKEFYHNSSLVNIMIKLFTRWNNEKEYENIKDYGNVLRPLVEKIGGKFIKMNKSPFGFKYQLDGVKYQISLTKRGIYSYKRV